MAKRRRPTNRPGDERQSMTEVSRMLAPLAADEADIRSHPPLLEAENLRQQGISLRAGLQAQGLLWTDILSELRSWERDAPTPIGDLYVAQTK